MTHYFEIMKVFDHHNRGQFIFARQIETERSFTVKEGSILGGIPLYPYLDMPRILDDNQQQRLDVFVFRPLEMERFPADYFKEGQLVELVVPD